MSEMVIVPDHDPFFLALIAKYPEKTDAIQSLWDLTDNFLEELEKTTGDVILSGVS